ncbi:MAG TPA: hypothetical protein VF055_11465 [Steroidobacteraceae bacterium]|jgi:hypothetical protein
MTAFEFLLALYSIVAGLGVSLLVRSVGQLIEARDRVRLYWVHTCWLLLIFVAHVVSWFGLWQFARHAPWTILQVLLLLCVPILLYLISHLAVPELETERNHDMREYYYRHAHWSQSLLLAALIISTVAQHHVLGDGGFSSRNDLMRAAVAVILVPGIIRRSASIHASQAVLLLMLVAGAVSYLTAPIG